MFQTGGWAVGGQPGGGVEEGRATPQSALRLGAGLRAATLKGHIAT